MFARLLSRCRSHCLGQPGLLSLKGQRRQRHLDHVALRGDREHHCAQTDDGRQHTSMAWSQSECARGALDALTSGSCRRIHGGCNENGDVLVLSYVVSSLCSHQHTLQGTSSRSTMLGCLP